MSIIRNDYDVTKGHFSIKCLSALDGSDIYKYVHLENCGFKPDYYSNSGFYFMMRCELPESANGYLMGIKGSGSSVNTFYIKIENKVITWVVGADSYTHAWEPGVHDIGWADGKPVYDNALVNVTAVAHSGVHTLKMAICGVNDYGTFSYINSINLYRVNITVYSTSSPTEQSQSYLEAYYPTPTLRNAMKYPELLLNVQHNTGATYDYSASADKVTYGVQLDDLRFITGSGYADLFALLAEDNTAGADPDADGPSVASKTGESHNFAFYLGDSSDHIPFPDTYAISKQGATGYEKGELISGRHPKWSIWNDCIRFGKHGVQPTVGGLTYLKFNIFKKNTGVNTNRVFLENFENYDTSKNYTPGFQWSGNVEMEFHNGMMCKLSPDNLIVGGIYSPYKALLIYSPSFATGGDIGSIRLGNLPLWNYSVAEQDAEPALDMIRSYGGGLIIRAKDYQSSQGYDIIGTIMAFTDEKYTKDGQQWPKPLSSDTVNKSIKTDEIDGSGYFFDDSSTDYMRILLQTKGQQKLKMDLCLMKTVTRNGVNINEGDIIDCSAFIPAKEGLLKAILDPDSGQIDPRAYYSRFDRFILGEVGGVANINGTEYLIGVQTDASDYRWKDVLVSQTAVIHYGHAINVGFALMHNNTFLNLFDNNVPIVFGYIQIIQEYKDVEINTVSSEDAYITIDEETYEYTRFYVERTGSLVDGNVVSQLEGDVYTKSVDANGNLIFLFEFNGEALSSNRSDRIEISMIHSVGGLAQETKLVYEYDAIEKNDMSYNGFVRITISKENDDTKSRITVDHSFFDYSDEDNSCYSTTIKSRKITDRRYAFTKTVFNCGNPRPSGYFEPWNTTAGGSPYLQSVVQPFGVSASQVDGQMGALFFMWKDLFKRVQDEEALPSDPMTAWVRIFGTETGPHAWDFYRISYGFDTKCECPYFYFVISSNLTRYFYFHTHDRLISYNVSDFVDSYVSVFDDLVESEVHTSTQVTDMSVWEGKTIKFYKADLHEPKDTWEKTEIATFVWDSQATSDGYKDLSIGLRLQIDANQIYNGYANLNGMPTFEPSGMYRLRIKPQTINGTTYPDPTPGTMYYIDIY